MRHQRKGHKIGRGASHRKATLAALSKSLIEHKKITTTYPKAKALRVYVEPLIHRAKEDTSHNRRQVFRHLQDNSAVSELFGEIGSKVGDRPGGYTRIVKLGRRKGDGAEIAMIELVDYNDVKPDGSSTAKKKTTRRSRRKKSSGDAPVASAADAIVEDVAEVAEVVEDVAEVVEEVAVETESVEAEAAPEEPEAKEDVVEEAPVEPEAVAEPEAEPVAESVEAEAAPEEPEAKEEEVEEAPVEPETVAEPEAEPVAETVEEAAPETEAPAEEEAHSEEPVAEEVSEEVETEVVEAAPEISGERHPIEALEGVGPAYGQQFRGMDIEYVDQLLEKGATSEGRAEIGAGTSFSPEQIQTWVSCSDLFRLDGVEGDYAELLQAADVASVQDLSGKDASDLLSKMEEANNKGEKKLVVDGPPSADELGKWINQAKALDTILSL